MVRQKKTNSEKNSREKNNHKNTNFSDVNSCCQGSQCELFSTIKNEMNSESSMVNKILLIIICLSLWIFHFKYLNTLFENDRHFSHLADFEREMTYRTEMGLYYSYYKTIINAETFAKGVQQIMNDNITEYGHTINTLNRFNLYSEVLLAPLYRLFTAYTKQRKIRTQDCYWINRGEGFEPVESCEGIGNPHYFYIYGAFFFAGSTLPSIYIIGYLIGNGHLGGIISAAAYVFNHGEATRAQWTPPLRETFAYPVFLAQTAVVTYILKYRPNKWTFFATVFLNTTFMLFWQFAQFALATQLASIYVAYVLEYISTNTLKPLVRSFVASFIFSIGLLFGNRMLLSSLFFGSIVALSVALILRPLFNRIRFRPFYIILHLIVYLSVIFGTKFIVAKLLNIRDDDHVFDILKSKFTDFANFHTQLYTCAAEFDFLTMEYVSKIFYTGLIPFAVISFILIIAMLFNWECNWIVFFNRSVSHSNHGKPFAELVYHFIQLILFAIMAGMIMRLKLFLTAELCVMTVVMLNKHFMYVALQFRPHKYRIPLAIAILSLMAYRGHENIRHQLSIHGEYSNPEQESLFTWINQNTKETAVFAGSMPVMANVKLSTERPIVNHPHYEHEEIRERTLKVYSMYSRKPLNEVYQTLKGMKIDYYVFQPHSCTGKHPKPNCTYIEMWDMTDPQNRGKESICDIIETAMTTRNYDLIKPFRYVYSSRSYIIFQL